MTAPLPPTTALVPPAHLPRYPLAVGGVWHMTCLCCWWQPFAIEPRPVYIPRGAR